jgi:hypothetical protein
MLRQVLARPDQAPIEAGPTVTEAGTTRPGRPEAPPPAIGNRRPARGRALTVALAAAGLATAVTVMIGMVQAPNREAMVSATPRALVPAPIRPAPGLPEPATRAVATEPSQGMVTTPAARAATPAPSPAPAVRRRAREPGHAHATPLPSIDADGIVNL